MNRQIWIPTSRSAEDWAVACNLNGMRLEIPAKNHEAATAIAQCLNENAKNPRYLPMVQENTGHMTKEQCRTAAELERAGYHFVKRHGVAVIMRRKSTNVEINADGTADFCIFNIADPSTSTKE